MFIMITTNFWETILYNLAALAIVGVIGLLIRLAIAWFFGGRL